MDLPRPAAESSYKCIKTTVHKASTSVQKISMQTAAAAEYEQAEQRDGDENRDIHVSSDGTWITSVVSYVQSWLKYQNKSLNQLCVNVSKPEPVPKLNFDWLLLQENVARGSQTANQRASYERDSHAPSIFKAWLKASVEGSVFYGELILPVFVIVDDGSTTEKTSG